MHVDIINSYDPWKARSKQHVNTKNIDDEKKNIFGSESPLVAANDLLISNITY